jgi:hypothetical protein
MGIKEKIKEIAGKHSTLWLKDKQTTVKEINQLISDYQQSLLEKIRDKRKNGVDGIPPKEAQSLTNEQYQFMQWESIGFNQALDQVEELLGGEK